MVFCQQEPEKFQVNLGIENRITPYDFGAREGAYLSDLYFITTRDKHLSGNSINLELEYFWLPNTSVGLMQNIRYDELYADLYLVDDYTTSQSSMKKRVISDTGLFLKHYVPLRSQNKAFFGLLGYGLMNNNTSFTVKRLIGKDSYGNYLYSPAKIDYKFQSIFVGLGYKYNKFEIILGNHFVPKRSDPFREGYSEGFGMPFIRLGYNIYNF